MPARTSRRGRDRSPYATRRIVAAQPEVREFVLSLTTVRNDVSNVFTKLQVVDRAQAIIKAPEAGMG